MEPVLITVNEAAEALRIGRTTVYRLIREGQLGTVQIGSRRLVTVASVRACANAGATA